MRKFILGLLLIGLTALPATAQVKVGILMGFSGPLASLAPAIEAGALLAVDQANAAGGLFGKPIQTVSRDTQLQPAAGRDAAAKLIELDRVPAIVGALSSGVTTAATSVTIPGQVVMISPSSTAPTLTSLDDNDFFFRTAPSDALQGKVQGALALNNGFRKASVLYVNNPYGKGLAENFKKAFEARGEGKVVAMVAYEQKKPSYRGEAQSALRAKPDVVNVISYPEDGNKQLVSLIEQGYAGEFIFADGMKADDVAKGPAREHLDGSTGTAPGSFDSPVSRDFSAAYDAFTSRTGKKVDKSAPYQKESYDAMTVILLAIAATGPSYNGMSQKAQGKAIRDNIRKIANSGGTEVGFGEFKKAFGLLASGQKIDYQGVSGPTSFDKNGDPDDAAYEIWMFKKGRVSSIWTVQ